MQTNNLISKVGAVSGWVLLAALIFAGCQRVHRLLYRWPPLDLQLYNSYHQTRLKVSTSANVLAAIHKGDTELLSQSQSVIATAGQAEEGYKSWLNMVAFDENTLTAARKYIFIVDDTPNIMEEPLQSASFDCEMVLAPDILDEPYANENARRIAILRRIQEDASKDAKQVGSDNKVLDACAMMVHQALQTVLVQLDASAAAASKLSEPAGLDFSHVSLGPGKIQMLIEYDIVKVKMRLGLMIERWNVPTERLPRESNAQQPNSVY
ncbi:MAG: hypothetical protein ACYTEL_01210 [Planctomycetota bacterium]